MSERDAVPENEHPSFLVIGATGGIGSELCRQLARDGARLMLAARSEDRLRQLGDELDAPNLALDAREPEKIRDLFKATAERFGRIDGVANLVGSLHLKPAPLTRDEEWNDTVALNLSTAFYTVREAARTMRKEGGSVVLMSSAAAQMGLPNHEAIAAAKAGVEGLVRAAAASHAGRGLRVNAVAPGLVATPLTRRITESDRAREASEAMHALGRIGEPAEVAAAVAWLLDPRQSWITGQVLRIDGGLSTLQPRPR